MKKSEAVILNVSSGEDTRISRVVKNYIRVGRVMDLEGFSAGGIFEEHFVIAESRFTGAEAYKSMNHRIWWI